MINKNNICVIVGSYPQNHMDTALASLTIESFKRQGYDICFVSHSPLNNDIQKTCKYYIYSDENYTLKFPTPSPVGIFHANAEIHYQTNWGNKVGAHSYSVLTNVKNALWFLKSKPYNKFIYVDSDTFLNQEDHELLETKLAEADFGNKDFWFMMENIGIPTTAFFAGDIDHCYNILSQVDSPEKYIEIGSTLGGYALEAVFNSLFVYEGHNGYLEPLPPRRLFKSPWLGISSTLGNTIIPGLNPPFQVNMDIVRYVFPIDPRHIAFVIEFNQQNELVEVKLYSDNNLIVSTEITTGPIIWWAYECRDVSIWKMEIHYKGKIINTLERTTEEIFWNDWSYLRVNNLEE